METLDGVLYVEGGEGGRGEDLKHKLLGHPPVIARLGSIVIMILLVTTWMMINIFMGLIWKKFSSKCKNSSDLGDDDFPECFNSDNICFAMKIGMSSWEF